MYEVNGNHQASLIGDVKFSANIYYHDILLVHSKCSGYLAYGGQVTVLCIWELNVGPPALGEVQDWIPGLPYTNFMFCVKFRF